jgi:hypothetical protein
MAIGRGPHLGKGSKVNANPALLVNPVPMNFAALDPESAAACREHFRPALEGPVAAADADKVLQALNAKGGKNMRKSLRAYP